MKKITIFRVDNYLLLKNLGFVYWHIASVILWLQGFIIAGALGIAYFDKKPIADTLYLAFITSLTIGYGDIAPETAPAKIIAIAIGFEGIIFTGIVVAASLKALEMTINQQKTTEGR